MTSHSQLATRHSLSATYRVQLNKQFTLNDARRIVPYLDRLGISHLYCSPILAARPGGTHGYDVADPARDAARFIMALEHLALGRLGSIRALDAVADVFEETYAAVGRPGVVAGLPFYKAATCLQLAAYGVHHKVSHEREKVAAPTA